jgi:3-hydroxyisobutyryl-CoA hydrolase
MITNSFTSFFKYPFYLPTKLTKSMGTNAIEFDSISGCRIINLNRPRSLNALNMEMIVELTKKLLDWKASEESKVVIINSKDYTNSKAFCAGGDIVEIFNSLNQIEKCMSFFRSEYGLNHLIATYNKPIVSIWNGFVSMRLLIVSGWRSRNFSSWTISNSY